MIALTLAPLPDGVIPNKIGDGWRRLNDPALNVSDSALKVGHSPD